MNLESRDAKKKTTRQRSLCFATDEDEHFCNTLSKCVYNLHEEIFCLIEYYVWYILHLIFFFYIYCLYAKDFYYINKCIFLASHRIVINIFMHVQFLYSCLFSVINNCIVKGYKKTMQWWNGENMYKSLRHALNKLNPRLFW